MRAVAFYEHGSLEQVTLTQVPEPTPGPGEVVLSVRAAALNRLDLWVLAGWPGLRLTLPHVMGSDGAGVVSALGPGVTGFAVGDRVAVNPTRSCGQCTFCLTGRENMCDAFAIFGEHLPGFFASSIAVPARNLLTLPDDVSFVSAAAASLVFVTAWHSLIRRGGLRAGEDVLVIGAGGGVNTAAIQIARLAGARRVFVVGSTEEKLARAAELGADVLIDRAKEDWSKAVHRLSDRQGVDVVVDNVGAATFHGALRALKKGGRLLTVGNTSGARLDLDNRLIFGKHLSVLGSTMGTHADYVKVMSLVFAGRLRPVVDTRYPLAEAKQALERLERGDVAGKLVLEP